MGIFSTKYENEDDDGHLVNVYCVYDSKARAFMNPFMQRSPGEAIRTLSHSWRNPESLFASDPGDFTLMEIATFHVKTGVYTAHKTHVNLGTILQLKGPDLRPGLTGMAPSIQNIDLAKES